MYTLSIEKTLKLNFFYTFQPQKYIARAQICVGKTEKQRKGERLLCGKKDREKEKKKKEKEYGSVP